MPETTASDCSLVISVVSHGHGLMVQRLLHQIAALTAVGSCTVQRVVLTLNVPEAEPVPPSKGWPFKLQTVHNLLPAGFGANHNRALNSATEPFVCVLNPDIELTDGDPFMELVQCAAQNGTGCAYPEQLDAQGKTQDHERELPTPAALWRRRMRRQKDTRMDWVNAACLVLPRPVWLSLAGFDERYFMYCEDVDLCLRLQQAGWALARAPVQVVHVSQRDSHRRWQHLRWHLMSLLRLWCSPAYRWARKSLPRDKWGAGNIGHS